MPVAGSKNGALRLSPATVISTLEISATNSSLDEASSKSTSIKEAEERKSCTVPPNATDGGNPNPVKETEPVPSEAKEIEGNSNALLTVSVTDGPKDETLMPLDVDERTADPLMIEEDRSMSKAENVAAKADCAPNNMRKQTRVGFKNPTKREKNKIQSPKIHSFNVHE
ncbi:MAG: hypothetical protein R8G34_23440 [Paracoccaceae bacterium]|nr:hypothetical protein [Paracoccaceae bacterium]